MATRTESVHRPQESESGEIQELYRLFLGDKVPALVGINRTITLPESIYNVLLQVIGYMKQGKGVSIVPVMQDLTTQTAANMLGVSRPFLLGLLTKGEIPFHKTGTHRRIYLKDLLAYLAKRDQQRKAILTDLAKQDFADGSYDRIPLPDDGGE